MPTFTTLELSVPSPSGRSLKPRGFRYSQMMDNSFLLKQALSWASQSLVFHHFCALVYTICPHFRKSIFVQKGGGICERFLAII